MWHWPSCWAALLSKRPQPRPRTMMDLLLSLPPPSSPTHKTWVYLILRRTTTVGRRQASARALGTPLGWTLAVCLEQDEDSAVLGFGVDTGGGFGVFDGDGDGVPRDGRLLQIHLRGCAATFSITNLCCIFFFFGLREAAQSSNFYFSFHN